MKFNIQRGLLMKKSLVKYPFLTKEVEIYERENGHKIVLSSSKHVGQ